jgi:hypothetical protein
MYRVLTFDSIDLYVANWLGPLYIRKIEAIKLEKKNNEQQRRPTQPIKMEMWDS